MIDLRPNPRFTTRHAAGFTLVELMISIALVLLILIGVNMIFSTTADTISAGQALNEALRAQRSLSTNLQLDIAGNAVEPTLSGAAPHDQAPFILINSTRVAAFLNRQDEIGASVSVSASNPAAADIDIRTIKVDPVTTVVTPKAVYNHRNHRVDQLSFFSKGGFNRQTGQGGQYVGGFSSNDAMIWYGHLEVYNRKDFSTGGEANNANYRTPGEIGDSGNPNPENWYATDWRLGRMAYLLTEPTNQSRTGTQYNGYIYDNDFVQQYYNQRNWDAVVDAPSNPNSLGPLAFDSRANDGGNIYQPTGTLIQTARYDLAGVGIDNYRNRMQYVMNQASPPDLRNVLIGGRYGQRIQCNPFVNMSQLKSEDMARAVPELSQGCTQFMVEFAGDYITQDGNGDFVSAEPDGVLDFVVENPSAPPSERIRSTRWYGFPRDVDGDGYIGATRADAIHRIDVVPVYVLAGNAYANPANKEWNFEISAPTSSVGYFLDRSSGSPDGMDDALVGTAVPAGPAYTCVWNPLTLSDVAGSPARTHSLRPYMIRVLATFADQAGRLHDGLTQQYVFKLD